MEKRVETTAPGKFIVEVVERRSRGELFLCTVMGAVLGSIVTLVVMAYL